MMLPILISVSLAPGSYFFSALAAVAVMAVASAAIATRLRIPAGIVLSLDDLFWSSVARGARACKRRYSVRRNSHCRAVLIMISSSATMDVRGNLAWIRQSYASG